MYKKLIFLTVLFYLVLGATATENQNPEAVSPGSEIRPTVIDQICPTFSWAQVPGAAFYKIAVFEMTEMYEGMSYYENQAALSSPVLIKKISGSASSWTPSLEEALQNGGRYVWFVQAQDAYGSGTWSVGKKFAVRAPIGLAEIKEKVKRELQAHGVKKDLVDKAFKSIQSQDLKSKSRGEIRGKIQKEVNQDAQTKVKAEEKKELTSKRSQTSERTGNFMAGALGSEGSVSDDNVYYGYGSGAFLTSEADENSFFGYYAGYHTDSGDCNTFIGNYTGGANTGGTNNTFIGYYTGEANTTGGNNTYMGCLAGIANTTGQSNTFMGSFAGRYNTGSWNTFMGYQAGYFNTSGYNNTFMGNNAGEANTTGYSNTSIGYKAGNHNTTGNANTFLGSYAGGLNTTGSSNTFLGNSSGFNTTGNQNVFLGSYAGYNETGSHKLYIENTDSSSPLIYGEFDNDRVTINGTFNVTESNINVDTGSTRARFKLQADGGGTNTDDYFNFTMRNDYGDVTMSVWDHSASGWLPMLSYEYLNSKVDFKDNDIVTTGTISSGGGAYTSGGAWIEASSRDYKENIMELDQAESFQALASLNPVRYNYKNKKDEEFLGFIAEEVPDLVAMNGRKGMRAMDIVAVLTKVVQDQQKTIDEQEKLLNEQNEINQDQDRKNENQDKLIHALLKRIRKLEDNSIKKQ